MWGQVPVLGRESYLYWGGRVTHYCDACWLGVDIRSSAPELEPTGNYVFTAIPTSKVCKLDLPCPWHSFILHVDTKVFFVDASQQYYSILFLITIIERLLLKAKRSQVLL